MINLMNNVSSQNKTLEAPSIEGSLNLSENKGLDNSLNFEDLLLNLVKGNSEIKEDLQLEKKGRENFKELNIKLNDLNLGNNLENLSLGNNLNLENDLKNLSLGNNLENLNQGNNSKKRKSFFKKATLSNNHINPKSIFNKLNKKDFSPTENILSLEMIENDQWSGKEKKYLANKLDLETNVEDLSVSKKEKRSFFNNKPSKELINKLLNKTVSVDENVPEEISEIRLNKKVDLLKNSEKNELKNILSLPLNKSLGNKVNPDVERKMYFSENFVSTKMEQRKGKKSLVETQAKALNIFQKEQDLLDGDNNIKRNKVLNIFKKNLESNNFKNERFSEISENIGSTTESHIPAEESAIGSNNFEKINSTAKSGNIVKVVDLSSISNPNQVLKEVANYIEMSKIRDGKELEVIVSHDDLGKFKIHVQKGAGRTVELHILVNSDNSYAFFNANEVNLLRNLSEKGISISDFKLIANDPMLGNKGNNFSDQNSSGNDNGYERESDDGNNSHDQGQKRRDELWKQYKENLEA